MSKSERRISFDKETEETFNSLKRESVFRNLSNVEMFALCLIEGKRYGVKSELDKDKKSITTEATLRNSNLIYLMMAIAVEDAGNLEILADTNAYFTICEEYVKTGVRELESKYSEEPKEFLEIVELECLEFFDENIGED